MSLPHSFKAMVVRETPENQFVREVKQRSLSDLPPNEVLIEVQYSSLNYKDALSATGNKGVTRTILTRLESMLRESSQQALIRLLKREMKSL